MPSEPAGGDHRSHYKEQRNPQEAIMLCVIAWLACAAIFLDFADRAPILQEI
jgi:hypothetical protein